MKCPVCNGSGVHRVLPKLPCIYRTEDYHCWYLEQPCQQEGEDSETCGWRCATKEEHEAHQGVHLYDEEYVEYKKMKATLEKQGVEIKDLREKIQNLHEICEQYELSANTQTQELALALLTELEGKAGEGR